MPALETTLVHIELCARGECIGDMIRIIRPALADDSICLHVSELRMTRGELFDAELRIVFSAGNNKTAIDNMHKAIKLFVAIIDNEEDTHVIAESLNFAGEYDGDRLESSMEERIIANLKEKTIVG